MEITRSRKYNGGLSCRLCFSSSPGNFVSGGDNREHFICQRCSLINTVETHFMSPEKERARYILHRNSPEDKLYRAFLAQAIDPAMKFIAEGERGLDYGCGTSPVLSEMLAEKGLRCAYYDPFFFPACPPGPFGYVFATETAEHFFNPAKELERMNGLLKTGGILVIMTERWEDLDKFQAWHYAKDPTHVCFYHAATFDFISERFSFEKIFDDGKRVVIFRKKNKTGRSIF